MRMVTVPSDRVVHTILRTLAACARLSRRFSPTPLTARFDNILKIVARHFVRHLPAVLVIVLQPFEDVFGINPKRVGCRVMYLVRAWDREKYPKGLVLWIPAEDDVLVKFAICMRWATFPRWVQRRLDGVCDECQCPSLEGHPSKSIPD
jgi:hypothetical protein